MIFRAVKKEELDYIFKLGYKVWSKNRTFEKYCLDNGKEDEFGTRYALEENGEIVTSIILLKFKPIEGISAYGIGSFVTPEKFRGKGYGQALLQKTIGTVYKENQSVIFLHSDLEPSFYEKYGFKVLPDKFQKYGKSVYMAYCSKEIWNKIIVLDANQLPKYF